MYPSVDLCSLQQCSDVLTSCGVESKDLCVLEDGETDSLLKGLRELEVSTTKLVCTESLIQLKVADCIGHIVQ